ncbi:MAG: RHS repeat-associated core domain-containing protein [Nitrospirae bacterium]|nr:RHS repeat-associated core domain-containing protein [Nitrospirota bacterium]
MRGDPYLARERKRRPRQHHGGPPQGGLALTYPGNKTVTYTYDALNRLETVTLTGLSGEAATYIYDDAGRVEEFTNFNGISTAYGYDDANRLLSIDSPVASYGFVLDGNGNRTDETSDEPLPQTYATGVTAYGYNAKGNRLLSAGTDGFGYDSEGQLNSGYGGGYTFDTLHRLTAMPGATFAYDGANNRLQAVRGGVTTRYLYDAAGNLLAETDGSNNITRYYVYGAGLLAMVTPAGEVYCYHFNATGGTVALTDEAQSIVNKYSYDPFGNVGTQVEAIAQPFKYVGQFGVMSESNGFYYMRARYYDPQVGRFISEDPLGFGGGDLNLMAYVWNNPVYGIDPFGLCAVDTEKMSEWLDNNIEDPKKFPWGRGKCAAHVRQGLEAGGIDTTGHPRYAKDYGPFLKERGFNEISASGYVPQQGDIIVIQPYAGGNIAGHIEEYTGEHWVSDFIQADSWAGPGYRKHQPSRSIYRP